LTILIFLDQNNPMFRALAGKIMSGGSISRDEATGIASIRGAELFELFGSANRLREAFRSNRADLCSIISAKAGACPENCSYCAQSTASGADVETFPLVEPELVTQRAARAAERGVKRFCIVTSGRRPTERELEGISRMVSAVRKLGLLPCATLGLLGEDELMELKNAGLHRFHHNLETSRRFFPEICTTHTYDEKLHTIEAVRNVGLSLCSGGIFGLGEDWRDRVDMAFELKGLGADSVPINFLVPIEGTPLGGRNKLPPLEALKILSLYRFILPDREIRVCGGRHQALGEFNSFVFMAGADGLLTGDCLTTAGRDPDADLGLIGHYGMTL
jgi:biotin synthase